MTTAPDRLFCFGLGYTASVLGRRLAAGGWAVAGTSRDGRAEGIATVPFSRDRPLAEPARVLVGTTHLLLSIPPDDRGDPVLGCHAGDLMSVRALRWIGYLSTTGVYGDRDGGWVDETAVPAPSNARSLRRVTAERGWRAFGRRHGIPVQIFRLAGIYGPGRNALATVERGQATRIALPGHAFSRTHVDDIATVLAASIAQPAPGAIYNVCDDLPAPGEAVVAYACRLLGVAPPPLTSLDAAALSPMARSFYADNRRVSNALVKRALGVAWRYPTYRAGLDALHDEGDA